MSEKIVLEGPDGMLYEIPANVLATYAVPGSRVAELRARLGKAATAAAPAERALPPGHHRMPPPPPPSAGAPIVLNIYVGGGPTPQVHVHDQAPPREHAVEGYHLAVDEHGIPHDHTEMLWGDYIDKQGRAAVGYHSHDPVTGNAR